MEVDVQAAKTQEGRGRRLSLNQTRPLQVRRRNVPERSGKMTMRRLWAWKWTSKQPRRRRETLPKQRRRRKRWSKKEFNPLQHSAKNLRKSRSNSPYQELQPQQKNLNKTKICSFFVKQDK